MPVPVLRLPMTRWLRCLLNLVTLAAFLIANSAGMVHAIARPACQGHGSSTVSQDDRNPAPTSTTGCKHCRTKPQETEKPQQAGKPEQADEQNTDDPSSQDDSIPCPHCPCPGGCFYCSVAKVPCCPPTAPVLEWPLVVADYPTECPIVCHTTFGGSLYRPPRS